MNGGEWTRPRCGLTSEEMLDEQRRQTYVAALLDERRGAEAKGQADRVRLIDDQLRARGHEPALHRRRKRAA